jgi:hypothetical protein
MTVDAFNLLTEKDKWKALKREGVRLAQRIEKGHIIELFQIEGFYVETFYDFTIYESKGLRSFTSTHCLEPYLNQIDISAVRKYNA